MVCVFRFYSLAGILDATVYEKVCQRLLELGEADTPVSVTNKTDRHSSVIFLFLIVGGRNTHLSLTIKTDSHNSMTSERSVIQIHHFRNK
jgi:hypothetical protein